MQAIKMDGFTKFIKSGFIDLGGAGKFIKKAGDVVNVAKAKVDQVQGIFAPEQVGGGGGGGGGGQFMQQEQSAGTPGGLPLPLIIGAGALVAFLLLKGKK